MKASLSVHFIRFFQFPIERNRINTLLFFHIKLRGPHFQTFLKGETLVHLIWLDKGFLTSAGHTCLVGGGGAGCVQLQRRLQHCSSVMLVSGAVASSQPLVCRASAAPPPLPPPDRQATHIVPLTLGQQDITNHFFTLLSHIQRVQFPPRSPTRLWLIMLISRTKSHIKSLTILSETQVCQIVCAISASIHCVALRRLITSQLSVHRDGGKSNWVIILL